MPSLNDIRRGGPSDYDEEELLTGVQGTWAYERHPELGGVSGSEGLETYDPQGVDDALRRLAITPTTWAEVPTTAEITNPETGELETRVVDTEDVLIPGSLQAYIDNPELADIEQAISVVRNVDPNDERLTPEQRRAYSQAQEMVNAYAAPGKRPTGPLFQIPGEQEREGFVDFVVQQRFGGVDPRLANPIREVNSFTEDHYEQAYENARMQAGGGGLHWATLTDAQKAKVKQQIQSNYLDERTLEIKQQVQMLESLIGRYDTERKRREKYLEIGRKRAKAALEESSKFKENARKRIIDLQKEETVAHEDLAKAQADALAAASPEAQQSAKARIDQIRNRITDIQHQKKLARKMATDEEVAGPTGDERAETPGLEGERQTETFEDIAEQETDKELKPPTEQMVHQWVSDLRKKFPDADNRELERRLQALMRNLGYNPFFKFGEATSAQAPASPAEEAAEFGD